MAEGSNIEISEIRKKTEMVSPESIGQVGNKLLELQRKIGEYIGHPRISGDNWKGGMTGGSSTGEIFMNFRYWPTGWPRDRSKESWNLFNNIALPEGQVYIEKSFYDSDGKETTYRGEVGSDKAGNPRLTYTVYGENGNFESELPVNSVQAKEGVEKLLEEAPKPWEKAYQ